MMEETEDDLMMKRVRIGRMPDGHRAGLHQSTVILRCERQRASKDAAEAPIEIGFADFEDVSAQVGNSRLGCAAREPGIHNYRL